MGTNNIFDLTRGYTNLQKENKKQKQLLSEALKELQDFNTTKSIVYIVLKMNVGYVMRKIFNILKIA